MKTTFKTQLLLLAHALWQLPHVALVGLSPDMQAQLATSSSGRVVLHVVCCCHDRKFQWHGHGVIRELVRN